MTQEQKDLLLKDLCARLPYGVKVQSHRYGEDDAETIETLYEIDSDGCMSTLECDTLKYITKPYLLPLSRMTEEQKIEYHELIHELNVKAIEGEISNADCSTAEVDWLNENHFDYRGLIEKGLAIDATNLNIY